MKREDLMLFLQDIVEEDSDLKTLISRYTTYGYGKYSLDVLKKIAIYGLRMHLLECSKYIRKKGKYVAIGLEKSLNLIKNNEFWQETKNSTYYLHFVDTPRYFFILFGPYGPVGEHAFKEAKLPEEFEQFIIN